MPSYEWTQVAYWKHPHLSYTVFIVLSILGGIIGLDHLYLRSPATAFLKLASFFVLPFFWYMYDILQATAEKNLFMKFGLVTPFINTSGIGAGMFKDPAEPVKEPLPEDQTPPNPLWFRSFIALSLLPFGLDHFIVGDKNGGLAKLLIMLIPILGFIYAIVWSAYSWFRIFFKTETLFSHGISRFVTPKMEEYYFAVGRLGMDAAKPSEPKKMTFMDLLRSFWNSIKKFFVGGDPKKEEDVETHGLIDAAIKQGTQFVKEKIIAKSPLAQRVATGIEAVGETAKNTAGAAIDTAGQFSDLVATAPEQAAEASGIIQEGLEGMLAEVAKQKAKGLGAMVQPTKVSFPPQKVRMVGGGVAEDSSTAVLALIAMFAIVASFSLGKYMFVKFHGQKEKKASSEIPPTRSEFVIKREGFSDAPPSMNIENTIIPATSASASASA
jgi:hypothetical protein